MAQRFRTRRFALLAAVLSLSIFTSGPASARIPSPCAAPYVSMDKLGGVWYEIARIPGRFCNDAFASTMTMRPLGDREIEVEWRYRKGSAEGAEETLTKRGRIVDGETKSRIRLRINWLISVDFWILEVGEDYGYAVVGTPDRNYLWILCRSPRMDEDLYAGIIAGLQSRSYDTGRLVRVPGNSAPETASAMAPGGTISNERIRPEQGSDAL